MKTIETKIYKVNGQWDVYANESTVRTQSFSQVASELGRNWDEMTSRQKSNFRKRHTCNTVETTIEVYSVMATVPEIFSVYQLQEAAINAMIHGRKQTVFLECKNGRTGYEAIAAIEHVETLVN